MFKPWQQIEQEAKDAIEKYHRERSSAERSQQTINTYFKAAIRAVRRIVSHGKRSLEFESLLAVARCPQAP